MQRCNLFAFLAVLFTIAVAPVVANAGGPLRIFDPATGAPYKFKGPVKVYTDLGNLGLLSNDVADSRVDFAWKQWTDVPSSSFEARIEGDFSMLGIGDITNANATQVLTTYNGGGIHVIYDTDGTILRDVFGVGTSVLGIASPEVSVEGTDEILESWVVLNGKPITASDTGGLRFTGVMTHEFGHSINLAHSQTNGGILFTGDANGPAGCEPPYAGAPAIADMETMYPSVNLTTTGVAISTVDIADDIASISSLYPESDFDSNYGTISGTLTDADGVTQVTGVNVIARNIANPWRDAVSAISGDHSQGMNGADGTYTFRGLTPGAEYVVYVDGLILGGSFSTPAAIFMTGQEEFYNGAVEGSDAYQDDACDATPITAIKGGSFTADIVLNKTEGAPTIRVLSVGTSVSDISADGDTIVGYYNGPDAPSFRWTEAGGVENLGGTGGVPSISFDGSKIVANAKNTADANRNTASIWQGGTSWTLLPGLEMATSATRTSASGVTDGATMVVGLGYDRSATGTARPRAFKWDATTNTSSVLETPATSQQSRAMGASQDGSLIFGWHVVSGPRNAALWIDGVFTPLTVKKAITPGGRLRAVGAGEATNTNAAGTVVIGVANDYDGHGNHPFWRWTPESGIQEIATMPGFQTTGALALSEDGNVIVGNGKGKLIPTGFDPGIREGFIWMPQIGLVSLADFLTAQGVRVPDGYLLSFPSTMSASGNRIAGSGYLMPYGTPFSWIIDIQKVRVCHTNPNDPKDKQTLLVDFPGDFGKYIEQGDTFGPCDCENDGKGKGGR